MVASLIYDTEHYRFQEYISDIAGQDSELKLDLQELTFTDLSYTIALWLKRQT